MRSGAPHTVRAMPLEPPFPIIPPFIEAIVLLRAAQAALARTEATDPRSSATAAVAGDVGAALAKLEALTASTK